MNYDEAREIMDADGKGTGLWHYTSRNDDRIMPIGYCSAIRPCPTCGGQHRLVGIDPKEKCEACDSKGYIRLSLEERCQGHPTREGAERHYYEYKIDNLHEFTIANQLLRCEAQVAKTIGLSMPDPAGGFEPCGEWTDGGLRVAGDIGGGPMLCDEHRNREGYQLARPFTSGMASIHS